jgi:hypothetical protein
MIKSSIKHLKDTGWGYWKHLRHSFMQSNRLIVVVLKSYVHGIIPSLFISDGPKTIVKIYREIRRLKHHDDVTRDSDSDSS